MALAPRPYHQGLSINGQYDENGRWQKNKHCFVYCAERCDCGPPLGAHYSAAHDKREPKGGYIPDRVLAIDEIRRPPLPALEAAAKTRGDLEYESWVVLPTPPARNPLHVWPGPGPEPAKWSASDGTTVYRSYADYVDG